MRSCGFKSHLPHLYYKMEVGEDFHFIIHDINLYAVVAELAYAHDSGSCPYYLGVGSSPINCIKTVILLIFMIRRITVLLYRNFERISYIIKKT